MQQGDEITLKELILLIKEYWNVLWGKKWYIVLAGLIGGLIFGIIEYRKPITYTAELTFMVNEDEGGSLGSLGGLAASFGLGGGGSSEYNLKKMLALLNSRNIIEKVLFSKEIVEGQNDFYANHIIKYHDMHERWEKSQDLKGYLLKGNSTEENSRSDLKALKSIRKVLIGSKKEVGILSGKINDETGIITLKLTSRDEELSVKLLEAFFEKLSTYYINKTVEKQKVTFEITKQKSDSLRIQINSIQDKLLKIKDSRKGIMLSQFNSEELRLERDYQIGLVAYGEALKNHEIADFALKVKTPFIQVVDNPIYPLDPSFSTTKIIKQFIVGGVVGVLFLSLFFILPKIYFNIIE